MNIYQNKILISLFLSFFVFLFSSAQDELKILNGRIGFVSVKGMNLLEAYSENMMLRYNTSSQTISLKVQITSFNFTNCSKSVEKVFNEVYMESHKHHWAKFEGKVVGNINFKEQGTYKVQATGKLSIHGVEKERKIDGEVLVTERSCIFRAKFPVKLSDHNIRILSEDLDRLAGEVEANVDAELTASKNP